MDERVKLTQKISGGHFFKVAATVVSELGQEGLAREILDALCARGRVGGSCEAWTVLGDSDSKGDGRMKRAWKAFWDNLAAALELRNAEIRTAVTLIEAIAADEFEVQLRMLTRTEAERDDLRQMVVTAGKLGLVESDLEPMARYWHTGRHHLQKFADDLNRFAEGNR